MDRVRDSLRPLRSGMIIQILIGVATLIILGAQCWARNTDVSTSTDLWIDRTHLRNRLRLALVLHVLTRIGRMDYAQPVKQVREMLDRVRTAYLLERALSCRFCVVVDVDSCRGCDWL